MSSALFQCDGAEAPQGWAQETWDRKERINHIGPAAEVNLRLENRSHLLLPGLDARQADLIRIAAYVYVADQSVPRGGEADIYGLDWRRHLALAIPVNDPDFWGTPAVTNALSEVLSFLSDDQWGFHFTPLGNLARQLVFNLSERELHGNPDCIILFSGGADSLCATVNAISQGRTPLLVSHQPALVLESRQRQLIQELRKRGAPWGLPQIGAAVHRYKSDARDTSQRTRGFLYGCIAATVASRLGIPDIQLADNGVVSLNLPINDQLIGALASRTTHPLFIRRFNKLLDEVFSEAPRVRNPLWNQTRAEALGFLKESGYEALLQETVSCSRGRGRPSIQPQCGYCFQCVDRRFGTMAVGLEEHDLVERYGVDIFSHELPEGEARTVATSYVRFAQRVEQLDERNLLFEFPQLVDCIDQEGENPTGEAESLTGMLHRHAATVLGVLESQITARRAAVARGELPSHSLLRLVSIKEQKEQPVPDSRRETVEINPSPDYRSVQWRGKTFHFSPFQAAAVKVLHEQHPSELSGSYILMQIEAGSRSLSDLFTET